MELSEKQDKESLQKQAIKLNQEAKELLAQVTEPKQQKDLEKVKKLIAKASKLLGIDIEKIEENYKAIQQILGSMINTEGYKLHQLMENWKEDFYLDVEEEGIEKKLSLIKSLMKNLFQLYKYLEKLKKILKKIKSQKSKARLKI